MRKFTFCMALAASFIAATFQGASAQSKSMNAVFSAGIMPADIADAATTALQKKANALPGKEVQFKWSNGAWKYFGNFFYTYNGNGWQTEMVGTDTVRGTAIAKVQDSFDAQFNLVHHMEYAGNGSSGLTLGLGKRFTYAYDARNRVTESIRETYNTSTGQWRQDLKTVLSYTDGSRFTSEYTDYRFSQSSQWIPVTRYTGLVWSDTSVTPYIQNLTPEVFSASISQEYYGGAWKDRLRTSLWVSGDSTIRTTDTMIVSNWKPYKRQVLVVGSASGEKTTVFQSADANGVWEDKFQMTSFADQHGNDTLINFDLPDGSGGWGNIATQRYIITYDASGNITEKIEQFGSMFSGPVANTVRSVYSYGTIAAIAGDAGIMGELSLFPNPAKEKLTIRLENASHPVTLQLTDLQGRTVMHRQTLPMGTNLEVSLPQLPQGVYLIQLTQGKEVRRTRLVIGN